MPRNSSGDVDKSKLFCRKLLTGNKNQTLSELDNLFRNFNKTILVCSFSAKSAYARANAHNKHDTYRAVFDWIIRDGFFRGSA